MNEAKTTEQATKQYDMNDALADFAFGLVAMYDEANGNHELADLVKKYW